MIYDSLTHITPTGDWFGTKHDASSKELYSQMHEHNVNKVILSGLVQEGVNDFIIEQFIELPDSIYPLPMIASKNFDELETLLTYYYKKGVRGIKLHPRFLKLSINESFLDKLFELCEDKKFTLFICTVPFYEKEDLRFIDILLRKCLNWRTIKIVLLHGGYYHLLEVAERVRSADNILIDLSSTLTRFYDSSIGLDIKYLFRNFDKRIAIGTDFPEYSYKDVKHALDYLGLPWEQALKKGILGDNLNDFLG